MDDGVPIPYTVALILPGLALIELDGVLAIFGLGKVATLTV